MHAITLMPSDLTVARQFLASHHTTRATVKLFSLLKIFRRIALRSSDSSTEVSYLSVLKNIVSDTRGLNFNCRRFPQGFSSGFLVEHFLRTSELAFFNPSNSAMFSTTQERKRLNEDYASAWSSSWHVFSMAHLSSESQFFGIRFLQDLESLGSGFFEVFRILFLQDLVSSRFRDFRIRFLRDFAPASSSGKTSFLQCFSTFWGVDICG